jgi:hypothetical protein
MDIAGLRNCAVAVRAILEQATRGTSHPLFQNFPHGSCGATADLVGRYLIEARQVDARCVTAVLPDDRSHAWVVVEDISIDITADQFGQEAVIVARKSPWHAQLQQHESRIPICSPDSWPAYPCWIWRAIVDGMAQRGFPIPPNT